MSYIFSKISFSSKGQSLVGMIIVLVVVGLLIGGLSYYLSKRLSDTSKLPEAPEVVAPEVGEEAEDLAEAEEPVADESYEEPYINGEQPEEEPIKECFIVGCSGELCTDDPEAISTCELLPGMECLGEEMSCQLVEGECSWVLSREAAECFLIVKEQWGDEVLESRIGHLFDKAEDLLSE